MWQLKRDESDQPPAGSINRDALLQRFGWSTQEELDRAIAEGFPSARLRRVNGFGTVGLFWLESDITRWQERQQERQRVEERYRTLLPELIAAVERVANLNEQVRAVDATSGAIAYALPVQARTLERWLDSVRSTELVA